MEEVAEGRLGADQLPRAREHQQAPVRVADEVAMLSAPIRDVLHSPVAAWHVLT